MDEYLDEYGGIIVENTPIGGTIRYPHSITYTYTKNYSWNNYKKKEVKKKFKKVFKKKRYG